MVPRALYESIANELGCVCSWAVWAKAGEKPKSNISDMSVFDIDKNPGVLQQLQTDTVMVALNCSRDVAFDRPFMNFHDANPHAQDYKIRFAFEGTRFYGAYMTDIIKDFPRLSSAEVSKHLKNNPSIIEEQIGRFRHELQFIGASKPIFLAFGEDVFNILRRELRKDECRKLIQLAHYSHHISKESYRLDTLIKLEALDEEET